MKKLINFVKDALILIGIIAFVFCTFTVGSIVHCLRANLKFRRKCRKIWRAMQKVWVTIVSWITKFQLKRGVERPKKQKKVENQYRLNKLSKQSEQYKVFTGQARVTKRVYKPAYVEVTFFTRKEVFHKEEHYTYIEYKGRKYKLVGKEHFMKFAEADVIQIKGEKSFKRKGAREHIKIQQVDIMAA